MKISNSDYSADWTNVMSTDLFLAYLITPLLLRICNAPLSTSDWISMVNLED